MAVNNTSVYGANPFANNLGDRIKELREARGESQADMAAAMDLKQRATIEQWEKGSRLIKAEQLAEIAKHFGVSADYLLGLSDVATPNADMRAICDYTGLNEKSVYKLHSILEGCKNECFLFPKNDFSIIDAFLCSDGFIRFADQLAELRIVSKATRSVAERFKNDLMQAKDISEKYRISKEFYAGYYNAGGFFSYYADYDRGSLRSTFDPLFRYRLFDITEQSKDIAEEICSYKSAQDMYDAASSESYSITETYFKEVVEKKGGD